MMYLVAFLLIFLSFSLIRREFAQPYIVQYERHPNGLGDELQGVCFICLDAAGGESLLYECPIKPRDL